MKAVKSIITAALIASAATLTGCAGMEKSVADAQQWRAENPADFARMHRCSASWQELDALSKESPVEAQLIESTCVGS